MGAAQRVFVNALPSAASAQPWIALGTRFCKSACGAVVEDLRRERIDAYVYCQPLHAQRYYIDLSSSNRRGRIPVTEKLADRAVALRFHCHLSEEQIAFVVSTMKDASVNVGAGGNLLIDNRTNGA